MELTNMIFVGIIVFVMVSSVALFVDDVQKKYSSFSITGQNFTYINETISDMSDIVNESNSIAFTFQQNQDVFSAFTGYIGSALSAVSVMFQIPAIMINVITNMAANTSPFIPSYVIAAIILAVMAMVLVSVMYMLLKVR